MLATITRIFAIAIFALCSTASFAGTPIYQWVDETGDTHFVSDLSQVPAKYRDAAIAASQQPRPDDGAVDIEPGFDDPQPAALAVPTDAAAPAQPSASSDSDEPESAAPSSEGDEVDVVGDDDVYGDDARERSNMRQLQRKAEGTRPEAEAAEQVRERPPAEAPREGSRRRR